MRARRAHAITAAGSAAVLLMVASGCAGDTGDGKSAGAHTPSSTTAPAAAPSHTPAQPTPVPVPTFTSAPALTVQKLTALTFPEDVTPGTYGMPVTALTPSAGSASRPVTPVACQDVKEIVEGKPATVGVSQLINWKDDIFPGSTTLAAYPSAGAKSVFRALEADLPLCRSLSGVDYGGHRFTNRIVVLPAPTVGDQAVRFQEVANVGEGHLRYTEHIVVRSGETIVAFVMADVDRQTPFPPNLVAQQVQRLAAAQHSPQAQSSG
ncbi:exported hypothetical protein [Actinacidiphila cocklensis]|uniref:PknH-like extracellular domain-containing protein n=1 Tax=Actinacidiphila cocklensis TaxID=887465 RepID=A0A9W4GPB8_9ACTN|nr:exported hypothetical protein [Actinacidiphila cocklensis]